MTDEQIEKIADAIRYAGTSIMLGLLMISIFTLQGHCISGAA